MAFGPIDIIVLEFKSANFNHDIVTNLTDLVSTEVIRILDLVIVQKDANGEVHVQELKDLEPATLEMFEPLRVEVSEMITVDDIQTIGKRLRENTISAIMLFENIWSVRLKQDMDFSGGRLVMHEHIPNEIVSEAIKKLAEYD